MTGLLVRSTSTEWSKGSVLAVDAGVHMSAIARIMEQHVPSFDGVVDALSQAASGASSEKRGRKVVENGLPTSSASRSLRSRSRLEPDATKETEREVPPARRKSSGSNSAAAMASYGTVLAGPLAGLRLPSTNPRVNAGYFTRELVSTYLITHAHLDHIAGFVINTASLTQTARPKRIAALTPTIDIFKTHIFNDLIWPNLSDEEGGIGLVTYMRLVEGGDVAIGEGDGRGYIEVCDGLGVKSWSISHGVRMDARRRLQMSQQSSRGRTKTGGGDGTSNQVLSPRGCVYDSTAYFIRDEATGKEVLIFGDVEPDVISWNPRTAHVWNEAAPKIAAGTLSAIFIECSYDDSQSDETLFGHLAPRHLIRELQYLANRVRAVKRGMTGGGGFQDHAMQEAASTSSTMDKEERGSFSQRKRKRGGGGGMVDDASNGLATYSSSSPSLDRSESRRKSSFGSRARRQPPQHAEYGRAHTRDSRGKAAPEARYTLAPAGWPMDAATEFRLRKDTEEEDEDEDVTMVDSHQAQQSSTSRDLTSTGAPAENRDDDEEDLPLKGVKVVIIHMKDTLRDDPIQLQASENSLPLPSSSSMTEQQQAPRYASPSIPPPPAPTPIAQSSASSTTTTTTATTKIPLKSTPTPTPTTSINPPRGKSQSRSRSRTGTRSKAGHGSKSADQEGREETRQAEINNDNDGGNDQAEEEEVDEESVEARVGRNILRQLQAYEDDAGAGRGRGAGDSDDAGNARRLGCQFVISRQGGCVWV